MREIREIVIHSTMGGPERTLRDLDRKHRQAGWNGCGYHFVIEGDGEVHIGRHIDVAGAHVRGFDKYSVGVCLIGGDDGVFACAQNIALTGLVRSLTAAYPNAKVMGHRDCPRTDTTCPGFDVGAWWETNKLRVANRIDVA